MKKNCLAVILALQTTMASAGAKAVAHIPTVGETEPIPYGKTDTDDIAIWVSAVDPGHSLILGTSKFDDDPALGGGLGVYDLQGRQQAFFGKAKLNNVDLVYNFAFASGKADLAVASNRSDLALDFFRISPHGRVSSAGRAALRDSQGQSFEPYGLCLGESDKKGRVSVFLPSKTGVVHHYKIDPQAIEQLVRVTSIDLAAEVSAKQDRLIQSLVQKEAKAEGDEADLQENLEERFALEGCVYDHREQKLYVGMENLGIWSIKLKNSSSELLIQVGGSWTDIDQWSKSGKQARFTDDIEGMDILYADDESYLIFSNQGISEFAVFELEDKKWLGNFKLGITGQDLVTGTDGLALVSKPLGPAFPGGAMVVHDDQNSEEGGNEANANYKIVSLAAVKQAIFQ